MNGPPLTEAEVKRYARHLVLPEIGAEGQSKLKAASVLVVGVGGLGVPAAVQLAAAGVGRIGLLDGDTVEASNLQRQFIFSEADVGRKKAEAAAERLRQVNPNVRVASYDVRLGSDNALDFIGEYDVVIDATDNLPSRYLISDACVMLSKPDVYASAQAFDGQVSVFYPPLGPCYRCVYPAPPPPESVRSCEETGVMSAVPSVLGTLQAVQAVALILQRGSPLVGRLLVFDALGGSFDEVKIRKSESCAACGPEATPTLIDYEEFCGIRPQPESKVDVTPVELKAMLDAGAQVTLLDVREPYEHSICHLDGAVLVPLGSLVRGAARLDRSKRLVAYCHTGVRSRTAVEFLRKAGFSDVMNLKGGIEAWAEEVEPTMPRY
ncbi:MAG: molybdopterin-synthase adenylyltransferase MoeB [Nitrososphaerota archaeon]|nr:molybdopterin-synthase adenylyltransferase MoeB [Nitrososphaerota archaeon]